MKRIIAIEIDCGRLVCNDCDWHNGKGGSCEMFQQTLEDEWVRSPECIMAEQKAIDLSIKPQTPGEASE